ncbi:hypothetical protein DPEC_G00039510 [Dallia pectoralis]|uniref:Uncharacterized protein n=1 Tax=Dallia pectoralis TaxID=75939 RepID=A0ACC2HEC7_DALPE|nr:hypothetical protein DPEC_G00039510 [Dallia pectoralis]
MVDSAARLCPENIAENLEIQPQSEVGSFDFFSLALDESCDVRDTAQLLIFLRGITRDFQLTEKLATIRPMKGTTTGSDLFTELELIDLQSDSLLKEHFKFASLLEFYSALKEENFSNIKRHAQKMLVLFGSTYICEQTFSVMKFTKSRYRSSLTDEHLSAVLRISTSGIQPDFDGLVKAQQRLDFSH